jgi:hypothetical protein
MRAIMVHKRDLGSYPCTLQLHMLAVFPGEPSHHCVALHNRGLNSTSKDLVIQPSRFSTSNAPRRKASGECR